MKHVIKLFRIFIAALLLTGFAASVAAQTLKLQTVTSSSTLGANGLLTVTWTNSSPPGGNSQISSAMVQLPATSNFKFLPMPAQKSSTGTVTVSGDGKTVSIQKMSPVKPTKSFTVTLALDTAPPLSCGDFAVFTFTAFTGSSLSGDMFQDQTTSNFYSTKTVTYSCTTGINCDTNNTFSGDLLEGTRLFNKDGSFCSATTVFTSVDATNKKVGLTAGGNQPNALFEAVIGWPAELVDPNTGMPKATKVSWQVDSSGNPINFATGRACIGIDATAYATLAAPIGGLATDTTVVTTTTVNFATPPSSTNPTPIVVDSERMNVIGQSGNTLTVQRGAGGTAVVAHALYYENTATAKSLMSTPFPLDGNGKVMLVCIVAEEFETTAASQCSPTTPAQACVQVKTTVLGDLYLSRE